jgi:hypothetical protein
MYSCLYRLFAQFFVLSYVNFEGCDVMCVGLRKVFKVVCQCLKFLPYKGNITGIGGASAHFRSCCLSSAYDVTQNRL